MINNFDLWLHSNKLSKHKKYIVNEITKITASYTKMKINWFKEKRRRERDVYALIPFVTL